MKKFLSISFLFVFLFLIAGMKWSDSLRQKVQEQLDKFNTYYPQEKVYLHLDRSRYALGEDIWFQVYLADGRKHTPDAYSRIVYVELIGPDDRILETRRIGIEGGTGSGDFRLPAEGVAGEYIVRAYTNFMRNFDAAFFFQHTVSVFDLRQPSSSVAGPGNLMATDSLQEQPAFALDFFPEGGDLVSGLSSVVAFRATDRYGQAIEVEGRVYDETGSMATPLKTIDRGMGFFSLKPASDRKYYAEVEWKGISRRFDLPPVRSSGYVLRIDNRKEDVFGITFKTNIPDGMDGALVVGHIRGDIFCFVEGRSGHNELKAEVPKAGLPDGVVHFTLFNRSGMAVCERLVFLQQAANRVDLVLKSDRGHYARRRPVELGFQVTGNDGRPLAARLSVAVTDRQVAPATPEGQDIRSYLLLNSDLPGDIEDPAYFFAENTAARRLLLDLLLLTHGWRRFVWEDIMADQLPAIDNRLEQGFSIGGVVTRRDRPDKPVPADVYVTVLEHGFVMEEVTTDESGEFLFTGFQFPDTTRVLLQANAHKSRRADRRKEKADDSFGPDGNRNVSILVHEEKAPEVSRRPASIRAPVEDTLLAGFLADGQRIAAVDSTYRNIWSIELDEVEVKSRRIEAEPEELRMAGKLYSEPSYRLTMDSIIGFESAQSVFEIIRGRVPGVQVFGSPPDQYAVIRGISSLEGSNEALIVIDGIPTDNSAASSLNIFDIAVIDVLSGAKAALYGMRGANGVIAIYTRRGRTPSPNRQPQPGILQLDHPGYYQVRQFYAPTYDRQQPGAERPDYRTTLHWAPQVRVGEDGMADLRFFTSDKLSSYEVIVEGMTVTGQPVYGRLFFDVDEP